MDRDKFENEVIDRLARIETDQKYIREEIASLKDHEERIKALEMENEQRKGKLSVFSAMWGVIGAATGSIIVLVVEALIL